MTGTMKWMFAFIAMFAGTAVAVQSAANAALASRIGLGAALVVNTLLVLAGTLVVYFAQGAHLNFFPAGAPLRLYVGGVCGFLIILSLAFVFPRIGAAMAIALVVLGQGVAALVIDHYGLLGMPVQPVTMMRVGGLVLMVGGLVLIRN